MSDITRMQNGPEHCTVAHQSAEERKFQEVTSCLLNCFPKVPCLTETQTCLVPGTFPFNFQTDVYSTGNVIRAALNRVQQTGWEPFSWPCHSAS